MRTVDRYVLRVLADRWVTPGSGTTLRRSVLDLAPRPDALAAELAGRGFQVTSLALRDGSLHSLAERMVALPGSWDAITCRGILNAVDDWPELVGRLAARLRPGGVLIYSVEHGGTGWSSWLGGRVRRWVGLGGPSRQRPRSLPAPDLVASLRRTGLVPRHLMAFGDRGSARQAAGYLGYSVKRVTVPQATPARRRDLTNTGERWLMSGSLATR